MPMRIISESSSPDVAGPSVISRTLRSAFRRFAKNNDKENDAAVSPTHTTRSRKQSRARTSTEQQGGHASTDTSAKPVISQNVGAACEYSVLSDPSYDPTRTSFFRVNEPATSPRAPGFIVLASRPIFDNNHPTRSTIPSTPEKLEHRVATSSDGASLSKDRPSTTNSSARPPSLDDAADELLRSCPPSDSKSWRLPSFFTKRASTRTKKPETPVPSASSPIDPATISLALPSSFEDEATREGTPSPVALSTIEKDSVGADRKESWPSVAAPNPDYRTAVAIAFGLATPVHTSRLQSPAPTNENDARREFAHDTNRSSGQEIEEPSAPPPEAFLEMASGDSLSIATSDEVQPCGEDSLEESAIISSTDLPLNSTTTRPRSIVGDLAPCKEVTGQQEPSIRPIVRATETVRKNAWAKLDAPTTFKPYADLASRDHASDSRASTMSTTTASSSQKQRGDGMEKRWWDAKITQLEMQSMCSGWKHSNPDGPVGMMGFHSAHARGTIRNKRRRRNTGTIRRHASHHAILTRTSLNESTIFTDSNYALATTYVYSGADTSPQVTLITTTTNPRAAVGMVPTISPALRIPHPSWLRRGAKKVLRKLTGTHRGPVTTSQVRVLHRY
ncbi:hypothetical protein FRB97_003448 [Tulasnella sp. 331]|nr:hypothetical protein FRB97_003448 [Tulasnella sp. 331]